MGKEKREKFERLRAKLNEEGLRSQPLQGKDHLDAWAHAVSALLPYVGEKRVYAGTRGNKGIF